jgi:hypothetical protein
MQPSQLEPEDAAFRNTLYSTFILERKEKKERQPTN